MDTLGSKNRLREICENYDFNFNIHILNRTRDSDGKYQSESYIQDYIKDVYNIIILDSQYKVIDYIIYPIKGIICITLEDNRQFDIPLSLFSLLSY